jgi:hypothetical protein
MTTLPLSLSTKIGPRTSTHTRRWLRALTAASRDLSRRSYPHDRIYIVRDATRRKERLNELKAMASRSPGLRVHRLLPYDPKHRSVEKISTLDQSAAISSGGYGNVLASLSTKATIVSDSRSDGDGDGDKIRPQTANRYNVSTAACQRTFGSSESTRLV